jgi:hypothetical protein
MRWTVMAAFMIGCAAETPATKPDPVADKAVEVEQYGAGVSPEQHEAIDKLFRRKANDLQHCWQAEYERTKDRKAEGNITVGLTVLPHGKAKDVKILQSQWKSDDIEKCVVQAIYAWGFPEVSAPCPYMRTVHLGAQY